MRRNILAIFILIFSLSGIYAQKVLTLNDALQTGLKNNFDIKIIRNQAQISKNNDNIGTAGYLPTLEADGGINQSVQNINQHYSTGAEQIKNNAQTSNISAGIELDWTIFNGFLMFGNKEQLSAFDRAGMLFYRNQVEISSDSIISAYYSIVRIQQLIKLQNESIKISSAKLEVAKTKFDIGSASKLDYLQSKVDLNADSTLLLKQMVSLKKSKENLKYFIGIKDTNDFIVGDTITLQPIFSYATLQNLALQQNNQILALNEQKNAALAGIKQAKSYSYPSIALSSRYNFSNSVAQAGFVLINQAVGLNYGASARWNIFEGGTIRTNIANAKINSENADLSYDQTVQVINTQLASSFEDYITNNTLIKLVKDNLKFAVENLDIATESYKIGKINMIDYRTAQLGYVNAYTNLFTAIYSAKNSELNLMRLTGQISKEAQ